MDEVRLERVQRILSCSDALSHGFSPSGNRALFACDLTMPQLKTLFYVSKNAGATSGQIASRLGVGLSTVTGIVDRLAEQDLVVRQEDPRDRRINRVLPTMRGRALVEEVFEVRNAMFKRILSQLEPEQLEVVENAFRHLAEAVEKLDREATTREVVA